MLIWCCAHAPNALLRFYPIRIMLIITNKYIHTYYRYPGVHYETLKTMTSSHNKPYTHTYIFKTGIRGYVSSPSDSIRGLSRGASTCSFLLKSTLHTVSPRSTSLDCLLLHRLHKPPTTCAQLGIRQRTLPGDTPRLVRRVKPSTHTQYRFTRNVAHPEQTTSNEAGTHRSHSGGHQAAPPGADASEVPVEHRHAAAAQSQRLRASVRAMGMVSLVLGKWREWRWHGS